MKQNLNRILLSILSVAAAGHFSAVADEWSNTKQGSRLYTSPDPSAGGGIHATIVNNKAQHAFAIASDNFDKLYKGTVSGDGTVIDFTGLPVLKYDLIIVCHDQFFEGMTLSTEESTLTALDVKKMQFILNHSVPFFETKHLHRVEGITGRRGIARGLATFLRERPITLQDASVRTDFQVRSIRAMRLEDVGEVGWQLVRTREIIRMEVAPLRGDFKGVLPSVHYPKISGIRVLEEIKDIGAIDLKPPLTEAKSK